ncbi:hypothetical protein VTL71DRAFT_10978 [Oculimacula yallundae]|uniref:Uncharacterized protein n=1 Tax=Oculimacula yallundae TaxID=86028 RepID=A0ABR4CVQ2_9HELO
MLTYRKHFNFPDPKILASHCQSRSCASARRTQYNSSKYYDRPTQVALRHKLHRKLSNLAWISGDGANTQIKIPSWHY